MREFQGVSQENRQLGQITDDDDDPGDGPVFDIGNGQDDSRHQTRQGEEGEKSGHKVQYTFLVIYPDISQSLCMLWRMSNFLPLWDWKAGI